MARSIPFASARSAVNRAIATYARRASTETSLMTSTWPPPSRRLRGRLDQSALNRQTEACCREPRKATVREVAADARHPQRSAGRPIGQPTSSPGGSPRSPVLRGRARGVLPAPTPDHHPSPTTRARRLGEVHLRLLHQKVPRTGGQDQDSFLSASSLGAARAGAPHTCCRCEDVNPVATTRMRDELSGSKRVSRGQPRNEFRQYVVGHRHEYKIRSSEHPSGVTRALRAGAPRPCKRLTSLTP